MACMSASYDEQLHPRHSDGKYAAKRNTSPSGALSEQAEQLHAAHTGMHAAINSGNEQQAIDGIFGFASALGNLLAEAEERKREQQRLRRNARARNRYAAQKTAGTLRSAKQKREAELRELDRLEALIENDENKHRCGCQDPGALPPCGHCESCEECWDADD